MLGAEERGAIVATIQEGLDGPYVASPAKSFIARMEDPGLTEEHRIILAVRALRHDPGCIEAHLLLAGHSPDQPTTLRHLQAAVAAGNTIWAPVATRYGRHMEWWGFVGTQPYMRAIEALGSTHEMLGNTQAAKWCYERLLRMNPSDDQGICSRLKALEGAPVAVFR